LFDQSQNAPLLQNLGTNSKITRNQGFLVFLEPYTGRHKIC